MRKIALVTMLFFSLWCAVGAVAGVYVFDSDDSAGGDNIDDLTSLDHGYYYTWYLEWNIPENEEIVEAEITFENIYNWQDEIHDLWINLLNDVDDGQGGSTGIFGHFHGDKDMASDKYSSSPVQHNEFSDTKYQEGTSFDGSYELVHFSSDNWVSDYADFPESYGERANITYTFTSAELETLTDYVQEGNNFGVGLDPDCHYYLSGVVLKVTTGTDGGGGGGDPVPEPATMVLLGIGCAVFAGIRRRRCRG